MMKTIKLENTNVMIEIFQLLVAQHSDFKEIYNSIFELRSQKEVAVEKCDYGEAAHIREQELSMIREMIKRLNSKGMLDHNQLQINILEPQ